MSKKRLGIAIAVLLVGVMAFGVIGSGAWFSDAETSQDNTFIAGTLDLRVDGQDDPIVPITLSNMKPCDTVQYQWTLSNAGSITGQPWIEIVNLVDYENGRNDPERAVDGTGGNPGPGAGELSPNLLLNINAAGWTGLEHPNAQICFDWTGTGHTCPLDFWAGYGRVGQSEVWEVIGPYSHTAPMVMKFQIPCTVGNEIQSDSVEFDIVFHLDQIGMP